MASLVALDSRSDSDGTVRVTVRGDVDLLTADEVLVAIRAAAAGSDGIVVDIAHSFVDVSGYRALASAQHQLEATGKWFIVAGNPAQALIAPIFDQLFEPPGHLNVRVED